MGGIVNAVNGLLGRTLIGVPKIKALANIEQKEPTEALVMSIARPKTETAPEVQYPRYLHRYGGRLHIAQQARRL